MNRETRWLRETYVDLLLEYAKKDPRIVLVEADLAKAAGTDRFQRELPERVINVGIAEASMISTAAGMAAMGKLPFTHTFTAFSSRRVCDQVTLSVAYAGLKVVIMGSDPGVTAELNGGTHMSMEDMAIMRNIPGMLIYEPVDSAQLRLAFPQILAHDGPVYIRLLRRAAVQVSGRTAPSSWERARSCGRAETYLSLPPGLWWLRRWRQRGFWRRRGLMRRLSTFIPSSPWTVSWFWTARKRQAP